ncbi:bifunctional DNA primase/polymerase [Kitasatospora sp. McL0602]|uniref:bifunctional DNA primase/polymerase n=1 Tax=Kitasatospora sp. McL0602 TaxID=3439530 RepID=UPI003F8CB246
MGDWHLALGAAHVAAKLGHAVFPTTRTKKPAIPSPHPDDRTCKGTCSQYGHGVHDATTGPAVLQAMFDAAPWATGYGIACGRAPHHLVGIDLDVKHGIDGPANFRALAAEHGFTIPHTTVVATPSGGWHLWFTAPAEAVVKNSSGELAPGIDVRGSAGVLVGPGSRTAAGAYRFTPRTDPQHIAPLPELLLALLTPSPAPATSPSSPGSGPSGEVRVLDAYVRAALDGETAKVREQHKPGRKNRLWASSAALGRLVRTGALPATDAETELLQAGLACGLDWRTCERTIRSGLARATTGRAT